MFELPAHTGHGRVWTEVLPHLETRVEVVIGDLYPDVWLIDGHNGDPGLPGDVPVVSCVYEIGWGVPELDRDHDADFIERIIKGTDEAVRRSQRIVTPSTASKRDVMRAYGIPASCVDVVPLGVDSETFRPGRAGPFPAAFDPMEHDRPFILFVSSLHPKKNLAALREAVRCLAQRGFPHMLVIVAAAFPGRDDAAAIEREAFAEIPGFPGRVARVVDPSDHELAGLMGRAAAVCQPSRHEGFGLSILEAMACGVPVVVSDRGALPELVGRAGWVTEPTARGVEAALVDILANPRRAGRRSAAARRRAVQLSWERTAAGWARGAYRASLKG
jgi:glycosyltransferase involved in cell wall biosynthesis